MQRFKSNKEMQFKSIMGKIYEFNEGSAPITVKYRKIEDTGNGPVEMIAEDISDWWAFSHMVEI